MSEVVVRFHERSWRRMMAAALSASLVWGAFGQAVAPGPNPSAGQTPAPANPPAAKPPATDGQPTAKPVPPTVKQTGPATPSPAQPAPPSTAPAAPTPPPA